MDAPRSFPVKVFEALSLLRIRLRNRDVDPKGHDALNAIEAELKRLYTVSPASKED